MATDHNFKVKKGIHVLGSEGIYLTDTNTRLHEGSGNALRISTGTGLIDIGSMNSGWVHMQANKNIYILPNISNGYVSVDGHLQPYSDSSKTLGADGTRWSHIYGDNLTVTSNIRGAGIYSTSNYTEIGTTSSSNLVFKRNNASYIQADQSSGYFIFITNGRSTSYANRALSLTADNNAEFGNNTNAVGNMQAATGNTTGKFAVMSTGVHASYDFYNNGTTYLNGSTIIDDTLNLTGSNRRLRIASSTVIDANRVFYPASIQSGGSISFLNGSAGTPGSGAQGISVRHIYAGTSYASSTVGAGQIETSAGFKVAGTQFIDSSANLINIGTINTGQGATEVHLMNQNVRTSDSPTFQNLTVQGNLSITGDINSYNVTDLDVVDKTITLGVGGTASANDGGGIIVDGANAKLTWNNTNSYWQMNKQLAFNDTATTSNQGLGIRWSGFDKEGTSDFTDNAKIIHTTNTGGHAGSVLLIQSQNDANDGIAFATPSSSNLKHNSNTIWTAGNDGTGSGLDADTVDGIQGASFLRSDANDTASGSYSFTNSYNEFGNSTGSVSNDGSWNARVNVAGSSHARLDVKSVSDGIITTMYAHTGHGVGRVGTMSNHSLALMVNSSTKATLDSSGNLDIDGNIEHTGLTMTSGTDIDQLYSATKSLTLSTSWQDTGIIFSNLATGSYIVQVFANDHSVGGNHYNEYYTGVMSWYASSTNSTNTDEINLHRAGHASNNGDIFLRTARTAGNTSPNLHLEIRGSTSNTGASNYVFKFRRMI